MRSAVSFRSAKSRIVATGLSWARTLLGASIGWSLRVRPDASAIETTKRIGNDGELSREVRDMIVAITHERVKRSTGPSPTIWYDGRHLIAAYGAPLVEELGYFAFAGVDNLTPADVRIFGTYIRTFEHVLVANFELDFLADQQRLLSRRTIVAQLRPNDVFYQALRRLRKYIGWDRSALVLAPTETAVDLRYEAAAEDHLEWYVAAERLAERLSGVHLPSTRIGRRYSLKTVSNDGSVTIEDLVVESIPDLISSPTPWRQLLYEVLTDPSGFPTSVPPAQSALVIQMGEFGSAPDAGSPRRIGSERECPYIVVLSDPQAGRFSAIHLAVARAFLADVGLLVAKSAEVSRGLVKLWTPLHDASPGSGLTSSGAVDDPDQIEALAETALASTAPEVLFVDALQAVQLRRGEARNPAALSRIQPLAVVAAENEPVGSGPDREFLELVRGVAPDIQITPDADLLWPVLAQGLECSCKDPAGIRDERVANLFVSRHRVRPCCTVLAIPLTVDHQVAGALLAYRRNPSEFGDIDKLLLRSLAARLAERIELHRELASVVRLARCLSDVAAAASPSEAYRQLVEGARQLLGADHAFMMAGEPSVAALTEIVSVAQTWNEREMHVPRIRVGDTIEGITGTVFSTGSSLVASDVSQCVQYVPLRDATGTPVWISSELAVPIKRPQAANQDARRSTLGVLDALWLRPHDITRREVNTLEALAEYAATVLELSGSLHEARQTRDSLQLILNRSLTLRSVDSEGAVLQWLNDVITECLSPDCIAVWSHGRGSSVVERLYCTDPQIGAQRLPLTGWMAALTEQFRKGDVSDAAASTMCPFSLNANDQEGSDPSQPYTVVFARPMARDTITSHELTLPATVWLVCVYHRTAPEFCQREATLLGLVCQYCEKALQAIISARAELYSMSLSKAVQEIAVRFMQNLRSNPVELIDHILQRVHQELSAFSVCVVYYDRAVGAYITPSPHAFPPEARSTLTPRQSGISEMVQRRGKAIVVPDTEDLAEDVRQPFQTSPFYSQHPEIRAVVALPLFDSGDNGHEGTASFCGVMFVNFLHPKTPSEVELEFLDTTSRFLAECGGIAPALWRMQEEALSRIQDLVDPSHAFARVLDTALAVLKAEFPAELQSREDFRLCGNIWMVTGGHNWSRLRICASVGATTGEYASVQSIGEGIVGRVAATGDPIVVADTKSDESKRLGYITYLEGMRSELAVPIVLPGSPASIDVATNVVGVFNVESSLPGLFGARQLAMLRRFSALPMSLILRLAERHAQLLWDERKREDEFIFDAARIILHDLSRPLRRLDADAKTIREALAPKDVSKIQSTLARMENDSHHFQAIVKTGILHLNRDVLEARRPLDVVAQVKEWAARLPTPIDVDTAVVPEFFIDRGHEELIARVLENLQQNSLRAFERAGRTDGRIWITLKVATHGDGEDAMDPCLDVYFHDDGPGIPGEPEELAARLFRPFSHKVEGHEGWGLGLPMVRQMMHVMRGEVELVNSVPNDRTTFRLRFVRQLSRARL
jgi:signal transduction histidine kinase